MANLDKTCIICRDDVETNIKVHNHGKQSSSPNHGNAISRWKHLTAESFCMLFGLPVNHSFVSIFTEDSGDEEESHLCNQCLQDLNDIHFVFWQLHNLEVKLIKLQNVIFQRLNLSVETHGKSTGNSNFDAITKTLFEDIKSGSHNFPTGVYISRWKDAVEKVNRIITSVPTNITVKIDPDFETETLEQFLDEDEDYFLDEIDKAVDDDDDDYLIDSAEIGNDDPISEEDFEEDDNDDDEDYKEDIKRKKRKRGRPSPRTINNYTFTKDNKGNFVCTVDPGLCQRTFLTRSLLSKHFSDYHKGRDFACDQDGCAQKFKSEITLINHKRKFHGLIIETNVKGKKRLVDPQDGKPGILCTEDPSICNRMYERLKDLNKHIADFHKGRDYACDLDDCVQKFKSQLRLSQHKRLIHKFGVPLKPDSKKRGKYKKRKNPQGKLDLPDPTISSVCEVCGLTIPPKRMKKHFKASHLGYGRFKCDLCGMDFKDSEDVKSHEDLHTNYAPTFPFTCVGGNCNEVFTNTADLRMHVKKNHLLSGLKCEICGIMKPNEFLMQRHLREVHDPKRERNMICETCGKSYFTAQGLKEHVTSVHSKVQTFCKVCGRGFYRKSALSTHMLRHQEVKPFSCSVCGKGFYNTQQLKKHEEIHSGVKKYECKLCGKRFKQMQNLRQHLRTNVHKPKGGGKGGDEGEGEVEVGSLKYDESLQDT